MSTWNTAFEASPAGADDPSQGAAKIRESKSAIRERFEKEHVMDLSAGLAGTDGWHESGSAKVYVGSSAPTTRPDGTTALDANDNGRLWFDTSVSLVKVYSHGTGWVSQAYSVVTKETITANKTYAQITTDTSVVCDNSGSIAVDISAGASGVGVRFTIIQKGVGATTLATGTGVSITIPQAGSIELVWDGLKWEWVSSSGRGFKISFAAGSSGNWIAPASGLYDVTVIGGGGGGGGCYVTHATANVWATGLGGSSGGLAKKRYALKAGTSCAYVVGQGGAGGTGASTPTDGTAGGTSSFTDGVNAISATGGSGGNYHKYTVTAVDTRSPGIGSGGDINGLGGMPYSAGGATRTFINIEDLPHYMDNGNLPTALVPTTSYAYQNGHGGALIGYTQPLVVTHGIANPSDTKRNGSAATAIAHGGEGGVARVDGGGTQMADGGAGGPGTVFIEF